MNNKKLGLPTKLRHKMMFSFCLILLLTLLIGAYVTSLFITLPLEIKQAHLTTVSVAVLFGLLILLLGVYMVCQMILPISKMTVVAKNIVDGKLDFKSDTHFPDTADEIQDLTYSLRAISVKVKELLQQIDKLSLKDKLTGLYNLTYIRQRLGEEIQRAIYYQRPCSFVCILIQNFENFARTQGESKAEEALKAIAQILSQKTHEIDRVARVGRGEFAIILPDKNKKKSMEIVEKINREILALPWGTEGSWIFSAGISENPMDGVDADELYAKAKNRMKAAQNEKKTLEAF